MSDVSATIFFGDAEHAFTLTLPMITELERVTGSGIGALMNRLTRSEFSHVDLIETIRLGLIGGGCEPKEAASLVATYAVGRPILEAYAVALEIVETTFFGVKADPAPATEEAAS